MPARLGHRSGAGRRRDRLSRLEWAGTAVGIAGALGVALLSPLAADTVLAFFLAALIAILAYRGGLRIALIAVPVAIVAYRGALDLASRGAPSTSFTATSLAMFVGAALGAVAAGQLRREDLAVRFSQALPNCVGYEVFTLLLAKDIARCQRYKSSGTVALLHLSHLDALTRPDAYQQHDLIMSRILAVLSKNLRRSDTACYLGDLHFAIAFPQTTSAQAWMALERVKTESASLPQRLCPALGTGPLDWDAVCVEYPQDGATPAELLWAAARTLGNAAQQRIIDLEKQRSVMQRQLEKLGYG